MIPTCQTCKHFSAEEPDHGLCVRHAPQLIPMPKGDGEFWCDPRDGYWPRVNKYDRCGEYEAQS